MWNHCVRQTPLLAIFLLLPSLSLAVPTVELTGLPASGPISGLYTGIVAIVTSDLPIGRVEFYLNYRLYHTEIYPPYSISSDRDGELLPWDTTKLLNGSYWLEAVAWDTHGSAGWDGVGITIFNNHPPVASCSANVNFGNVPLTVQFTGHASDLDWQPLAFLWRFGDGATSDEQNPLHTYSAAGVYTVEFSVNDTMATASDRISIRAGILPILATDQLAVAEAENYDLWFMGGGQEWAFAKAKPGYAASGYIIHSPDAGTAYSGAGGPGTEYWIDFPRGGVYYLWLRGYGITGGTSCRVMLNGAAAFDTVAWQLLGAWQWVGTAQFQRMAINIPGAGVNVIGLAGREDGIAIDRLLLTTDPQYSPSGTGPPASPRAARQSSLPGDANFSGVVNILDLIFIRNRMGKDVNLSDNRWADVNGDNTVNILDLVFTRNNMGRR